jgi:hypothetical protein
VSDRAPCTESGRRVAVEEVMLSVWRCVDSFISSIVNIVKAANGTSRVSPV